MKNEQINIGDSVINIKKDCKTLTYEFNQQLKINGYLMNESEFYCSRHEAKGE